MSQVRPVMHEDLAEYAWVMSCSRSCTATCFATLCCSAIQSQAEEKATPAVPAAGAACPGRICGDAYWRQGGLRWGWTDACWDLGCCAAPLAGFGVSEPAHTMVIQEMYDLP